MIGGTRPSGGGKKKRGGKRGTKRGGKYRSGGGRGKKAAKRIKSSLGGSSSASKWDSMSVSQRSAKLRRAMPGAAWKGLRDRMARTPSSGLTRLQVEALPDIVG